MQKITPFLWFNNNAEEAVKFYTALFKDSRIISVNKYDQAVAGTDEKVMTIAFQLFGQDFTAMNGGRGAAFNESISFMVNCDTQQEVDQYWEAILQNGGQTLACGWIKDGFGLSWQIVPKGLMDMINDKNPVKSKNVMDAMMQMIKLDLPTLEEAYRKE